MGAGALLEPASVVFLLVGGCWVNRKVQNAVAFDAPSWGVPFKKDEETTATILDPASVRLSPSPKPSGVERSVRAREIRIWRFHTTISSPDTTVFENRWFSRLIRKYPFLVEVWYWALIYWVYQLARAFSAVTLSEDTINVARQHALEVAELEKRLHIFYEIPIQQLFLHHPFLMLWINRIYSFIHIPGTILFLIILFWYTTTRATATAHVWGERRMSETVTTIPDNTALYQARRRTMALCNLLAFVVFTAWPCMPPRLLSDPAVGDLVGTEARQYGFVDTVHGDNGEASVWTQNKFCNQYAAMPSLHFGYSALIGLTIATIPLASSQRRHKSTYGRKINFRGSTFHVNLPSIQRVACITVGFLYPFIILVAIIATANHFILDAVAGAMICALAWSRNRLLLNLLPLQDIFLASLRIHFPEVEPTVVEDDGNDNGDDDEVEWDSEDERLLNEIRSECL